LTGPADAPIPDPGPTSLFVRQGEGFVPTLLTQGPWSPDHQFGGAAASLLATVVEEIPTLVPQQVARLTVDLLRPVPIQPLRVEHRIVRQGKRIQVVEAALLADGLEVARCSALRMRLADLGDLDVPQGPPWPGPPPLGEFPFRGPYRDRVPPGVAAAAQFAFDDSLGDSFVAPTWIKMRVPVVDDEPTSPLARMAFLADFASGVGHPRDLEVTGINADISLNIVRYPAAEWLCFTGTGWTSPQGIGHSRAEITDDLGVVASVTLARLVDLV
jgi:hypothetical protein